MLNRFAGLMLMAAALSPFLSKAATPEARQFTPDGATVYFVITDRFLNGDSLNDVNYGRIVDYGSERLNAATFHGGDFAGLQRKADEGYFKELGVDMVWMTDVYEQIHGWMSGSGAVNDFPHYGYHGYYPLDYTQIDKNYGTVAEFRRLVDTLHSQGIRVMLGANINDPGYPVLLDAVQYGFAPTSLTAEEAARHRRDWSYDQWFANADKWNSWYDGQWVRLPGGNWDETDKRQMTLYGMPDYRDEVNDSVAIPEFLHRKWAAERSDNDAWVNPSARRLRHDRNAAPLDYVIDWIASWVEEFGIDGFRCDIVEYSALPRWRQLSDACNLALQRWRANHPADPAADWTEPFYLTGDFDNAEVDYKPDYASAGFSSMVNCRFPKRGDLNSIVYTWQAYADSIAAHPGWHPFNYLNNSYHRDADSLNMADCMTTLLLSPGVAQIFYGDETGRGLSDAQHNVDSAQAFRSDMNWHSVDSAMLAHTRRLGQIRRDNPGIATGRQLTFDNNACLRFNNHDLIFIQLNPTAGQAINLHGTIADNSPVTELYTGQTGIVTNGRVSFSAPLSNVALIKAAVD
ncbi:MAG: hypothetical protein K2H61_02950 [Muribaculaceae bacterium]|nr:hypothetical protein [Muribaculaceae bacterium]